MISSKQTKREAKRLYLFCLVDGVIDESRARQVVTSMSAARHRSTPAVLARFIRWVRLDRIQHTAVIESAAPLPSDLQGSIQSGLTRMYGPGLNTKFAQRQSLIGGVRIQVGSDVFDGSVSGALTALEKSF